MREAPAIYLGRIVDKKHFRTFIYASDGTQKLVESWDAFEKHMELGTWFATKEDSVLKKDIIKKKKLASKKINKEESEQKGVLGSIDVEIEEPANTLDDDMCFEVKNDDFLPRTASK